MADNKLLQQMLERLVNEDQAKAEELFHEYVVAKSREIYEGLIESEIAEEEDKDEDEDEDMEEAAKDEDAEEDKVDENFEEIAIEADDEEADDMMGGDPTDDLEGELDAEMDDEEGEGSEEEMMQDLGDIIDELQAKFDALQGDEEEQGEFDGEEKGEEEMKDNFDLETVREYVEKVATPKGGDDGANAKSIVAGKNDMGGTSANIAKGAVESESASTKGGLLNPSTKEDNAGNINVPGGKAGSAFSKKEPGHGAEKKGAGENADNKQSLFRGRR
jgi:hypothetical protein